MVKIHTAGTDQAGLGSLGSKRQRPPGQTTATCCKQAGTGFHSGSAVKLATALRGARCLPHAVPTTSRIVSETRGQSNVLPPGRFSLVLHPHRAARRLPGSPPCRLPAHAGTPGDGIFPIPHPATNITLTASAGPLAILGADEHGSNVALVLPAHARRTARGSASKATGIQPEIPHTAECL